MKLKSGFMLRQIAGQWIVVPLGQRTVEFNAIMSLSETGAFIWKGLEQGLSTEEIVKGMTDEYEVGDAIAAEDVGAFLDELIKEGFIE